ncbi:conserved hypothetical protein [Neospora caninum Liverpool]|nr:conserved hypothetical protein [Neospora caninum Liverpool]CBZ51827.1 conserved hypothetical protein [Neospora caninum Liverpool]|eukprot:XP_003881860.1 conserved hypothetical protein [Neospora caninum Liverpool]
MGVSDKKHAASAGTTFFSTEKGAQVAEEKALRKQGEARGEVDTRTKRSDQINLPDSVKPEEPVREVKRLRRDGDDKETEDSGSLEEAEAPLAATEMIRMQEGQERNGASGYIHVPNTIRLENTSGKNETASTCCGIQEAETRTSIASLGMLYYYNPDSIRQFHTVSLLLPNGRTFLANVMSVVREPPPTEEHKHPKSVVRLSGGYTLTLSLDGVSLEDRNGSEVASWEAESVLYPVILEEVAIRDTAAVAPAQAGFAGAIPNSRSSTVPLAHAGARLRASIPRTQEEDRVSATSGRQADVGVASNIQTAATSVYHAGAVGGGETEPSASRERGRATAVRVLAVSRGNIGTVRISTTRSVAPGMSPFTCVFRTGIYGDYDPCNTPAVIAANFFTPLTASVIGGF